VDLIPEGVITMTETTADPKAELKAMTDVAAAIEGLDPAVIERVLRWAAESHGVTAAPVRPRGAQQSSAGVGTDNGDTPLQFGSFGELYAAASPTSDVDRTLVAAYWRQYYDGAEEFGAQELNAILKNLGYAVLNITSAFDNLKSKKPALVIQLKKSGTTRQARKTFKVTEAGKQYVEQMTRQTPQ
jgi:hypothetical protein